jgi:hypothetical protein
VRFAAGLSGSTRTPHVVHVFVIIVVGGIIVSSRCSSCTCERDSSRGRTAPVGNRVPASIVIVINSTGTDVCRRLYRLHRHALPLLPPRPLPLICQRLLPVPPPPSRPCLFKHRASPAISQWQRHSPLVLPCCCSRARLSRFTLHLQHVRA